jgi:hypothetical protein
MSCNVVVSKKLFLNAMLSLHFYLFILKAVYFSIRKSLTLFFNRVHENDKHDKIEIKQNLTNNTIGEGSQLC